MAASLILRDVTDDGQRDVEEDMEKFWTKFIC